MTSRFSAECPEDGSYVVRQLNALRPEQPYLEITQGSSRLKFFSRLPLQCIVPIFDDGHTALRLVKPPLGSPILVAAAHLRSKLWADDRDQHFAASQLRKAILDAEHSIDLKRTLVIGDLNMDPYDEGMLSANGLHAVMDKHTANEIRRTVYGEEFEYFYNPMWSRLGDDSVGPPGTFYYRKSGVVSRFWNTFDQILLRPELIQYYRPNLLKVIDSINGTSLIKENKIDRDVSDHLPIMI